MIELKIYSDIDYPAIKDFFSKKEIRKYTNRGGYRILSLFALYKSQYYLLWEDDNVIGCGVIRWKFSREFKQFGWWLYAIWIHPQSRGTGKGLIIMNKLIEELSRKRIKRVQLNVDTNNIVAQGLYKKIGFKVVNQIKSQIYMQYVL